MSLTGSRYKKLGLELVEPLQDKSRQARKQTKGGENKDDGEGDTFKMFLEEAFA
jgi:hypothetical protein